MRSNQATLADDVLAVVSNWRVSMQTQRFVEWSACCPAHEDAGRSLRIVEIDGGLAVRCMANCPKERVAASIEKRLRAALGQEPAPPTPQRAA